MRRGRQSKIREQHILSSSQQHVLRIDIAVDKFLFVGVLQSVGHLLHVGKDLREGDNIALGIAAT